jgi:hypothetical protein
MTLLLLLLLLLLLNRCQVTDTIEAWLEQLTGGMRSTLQSRLSGIAGMDDPFGQAPAQVLGLYHALRFTERWGHASPAAAQLDFLAIFFRPIGS